MKKRARTYVAALAALLCFLVLPAFASTKLSSGELENLLAPYAMYPDSTLGNILVASARPDELEAAHAWATQHPGLSPDKAMKESEKEPWDASVKALLLVPDTLALMCQNIDTTEKLGSAFIAQNADVLDTVQTIRKKAISAGTLKSTHDVTVKVDDKGCVLIGTANPDVIAVPKNASTTATPNSGDKPSTASAQSDKSATASAQSNKSTTSSAQSDKSTTSSSQSDKSTTSSAQGTSSTASASSADSSKTAAIVWGCLAISKIIYNCCVVDWYEHRYWVGPAYNHCYYVNGAFRAWGSACRVPATLATRVPPAPARPAYSAGYANWAAKRATVTRRTAVGTATPRGAAATNVYATPTGPARTTVRATPAETAATTVKATPGGATRTTTVRRNPLRRRR